jgi:hypothetical protein
MLVDYLRPGQFPSSLQHQDQYIATLNALGGDSTDPHAQIATLKHYSIRATFSKHGSVQDIVHQLVNGIPVPVGWLHHGNFSRPTGGGHWILVVGYIQQSSTFIVHDPYGKADLINGGYISNSPDAGKYALYKEKYWRPRWEVEGEGTGWYVKASHVKQRV